MDKNNDIQVNKVDKWREGVADVSLWRAKKSVDMFLCGYSSMLSIEALDAVRTIYVYLDEALDHFNELEARHQKDTGMISEYEEENRILREQRKELVDARSELAKDNNIFRRERDRNAYLLDGLCQALADKGIYCEWSEAALKWNLHDETDTICESCKQHYEEELRIREKEKDEKDKLIEELNQTARHECEELNEKIDRLWHVNDELNRKIKKLKKENKEPKDTIEKDREFAKWIGNQIVECIKQGAEHGYYEVHPLNRFDIHIEETSLTPMPDRHAIPKIAVQCNNVQTEMERDTAEHECEELEKKFKELVKENEDLKEILAFCERDANKARNLCHNVAFNAERARNKTPWFAQASPDSRYLSKPGDDI